MKKNLKMLIFTVVILELNGQAFSFCGDSHANLTQTAIFNSVLSEYLQNQLNIQQGLNGILTIDQSVIPSSERIPSDQLEERIFLILPLYPTVRDLLECGSRLEDIPNPRAKHHFHDPYRNAGLNNKTEHPALSVAFSTVTYAWYWGDNKFDLTGASNLKRASNTEDPNWEQEYENFFAWPDARNYFYRALTRESPETRVHYLSLTFLSLGHVLHLLEDMGVPPHARNDFIEAHFRGLYPGGIGNPLEKHVEDEIKALGIIPDKWLEGWTPQAKVFSKLAHYWDVNDYNDQYVGTSPLSTWGLSERTNYQFLSQSTIFRENIIINEETGERTKYYFPHPDVNHTSEHIDTEVYLWGLIPVDYRYISGYDITHLARTKFTQKYAYDMMGMPYPTEIVAYHTTFDEAVYEDYAKVTIPRTIDYATGLINYFFRGKLEIISVGMDEIDRVEITIKNKSTNGDAEQVLAGGTFELYWDDQDGTRTKIDDFTVDDWIEGESTLGYDDEITASFPSVVFDNGSLINNLILIYKGPINSASAPGTTDTDDISAIAIGTLKIPELLISTWVNWPCCFYIPCEVCKEDETTEIGIWNVSESSGIPQNIKDGTFDVYYLDFETNQLIPFANVTGSLDYCEEYEGWEGLCPPQPMLDINKGVIEYISTHRLILVYNGTMVDSENPNNEYHAAAIIIEHIDSIGGNCHGDLLCNCPW